MDSILQRLSEAPEVDHLTIFQNFLSTNGRLRLYLDRTFLVTFAVRGDRVLVLDIVHTMSD